jgi:MAPEG family
MKRVFKALFMPFIGVILAGIFNAVWSANDVVPVKYLKGSEIDVALKFGFIAGLPVVFMILSIMFYRGATIYGDTLQATADTLYLTLSKMILKNTVEQTLVFLFTLLSAAALKALNQERIVLVVCVHFLARILFWAGYLAGGYLNIPALRVFGFGMTLTNTSILLLISVRALFI